MNGQFNFLSWLLASWGGLVQHSQTWLPAVVTSLQRGLSLPSFLSSPSALALPRGRSTGNCNGILSGCSIMRAAWGAWGRYRTVWATTWLRCKAQRGESLQRLNRKDGTGHFSGSIHWTPGGAAALTTDPCPTQHPELGSVSETCSPGSATALCTCLEVVFNRFYDECRRQSLN